MDWITEQIAIGNYLDAQAVTNEVDAILCLIADCCNERDDIDALAFPLVDAGGNRAQTVLEALDYMHSVVSDGDKILVHCHAGQSRSVMITAAYLVKYGSYTRSAALELIQQNRRIYLSDGIDEIWRLAGC